MPQVQKTVIAVYGTLREGMAMHDVITAHQATFISKSVVKGFKMYDRNGDRSYPFILDGAPEDQITVELYRVGPKGLAKVDALEGYNPQESVVDCRFLRKEVHTVDGVAVQIHVWHRELHAEDVIILSGDWAGYMGRPATVVGDDEVEPETEPEEDADDCEDFEEGTNNFDSLRDTIVDNMSGNDVFDALTENAKCDLVADILKELCNNAKLKLVIDDDGNIVTD
jgi:gamma-glutamylcyclotransferase (GGCT)/AIG2-like uncharacterized protein YtfP